MLGQLVETSARSSFFVNLRPFFPSVMLGYPFYLPSSLFLVVLFQSLKEGLLLSPFDLLFLTTQSLEMLLLLLALCLMPYMLVLGATQCSVEVPGTFSNICEQKMDAEIGEILVRTAFAVPANTYMHCSWNVVANNDKSIAVATDNTNNLYVSAMNEEQFAAFIAGSCTWDSSALDWVGGSCAGSTNYGGKAKTGATHIEANWFSVTSRV